MINWPNRSMLPSLCSIVQNIYLAYRRASNLRCFMVNKIAASLNLEILWTSNTKISLNINHLKSHLNLPRANGLNAFMTSIKKHQGLRGISSIYFNQVIMHPTKSYPHRYNRIWFHIIVQIFRLTPDHFQVTLCIPIRCISAYITRNSQNMRLHNSVHRQYHNSLLLYVDKVSTKHISLADTDCSCCDRTTHLGLKQIRHAFEKLSEFGTAQGILLLWSASI